MKQKNLILLVVAVGCGLVAAFLTSQMNAKATVETVEVVVAASDIPVGVGIGKDDLPKYLKKKTLPKDAVPADIVENPEELVDRRLIRPIRTDETISRKDLMKGGIQIPRGKHLLTLSLDTARAAAGLAQPGSRVDVLAFVSISNKLTALPILVDMLVLAVNGQTTIDPNEQSKGVSTVSFAADRKQGLVLELAKGRGCQMSLLLRHPEERDTENDKNYNIDEIITLLQDDKNPAAIANAGSSGERRNNEDPAPVTKAETPKAEAPVAPAPVTKAETVKVPYALVDIKGGTELTADLIGDETVFGTRDLPKDVAGDAITDLSTVTGKVLRSGLGKGQWVTPGLVGLATPKPGPTGEFELPGKLPGAEPAPKAVAPAGPRRATRDVTVHTGTGSKTYRYEEWAPDRWRLVGEVRGRTDENNPMAPAAPTPTPNPLPAPAPEQRVD